MIRATRDDFSSSVDVHSLASEGFPCHEGSVPTGREVSRVGSLWVNSITAPGFALSADWLCASRQN
jgi:hypothetical protein